MFLDLAPHDIKLNTNKTQGIHMKKIIANWYSYQENNLHFSILVIEDWLQFQKLLVWYSVHSFLFHQLIAEWKYGGWRSYSWNGNRFWLA